MNHILSEHTLAHTTLQYLRDDDGRVGLRLFPTALRAQLVPHRPYQCGVGEYIRSHDTPPAAAPLDSLVHLKTVGQPYSGGFAQGRTMRRAPEVDQLRLDHQDVTTHPDRTIITTYLNSPLGYQLEHELSWHHTDNAARIRTTFINTSTAPISLEMLTSFSLGDITPFAEDDAPHRLFVHRLRSTWADEGRHVIDALEDLQLERSWHAHSINAERFGQLGSMPVKQFFPFLAVEDRPAGVLWGAQIAWAGSWQLEVFRKEDTLAISGGLADREFGHWLKTIHPGQRFTTPDAILACVHGNIDDLTHALTHSHQHAVNAQPPIEQDLPILANEWCTTWGRPTHDNVLAMADRLQNTDVKFLVIDAGWYKHSLGEWEPNPASFPLGLPATAAAIRARGLIPGLWFELEAVQDSPLFNRTEWQLKRDGLPITVWGRRFWDMTNPNVIAFLTERVVNLLKNADFGYLKVDYNETIGLGCDGAESLGEGLRKHIDGVKQFYEMVRRALPNLVIEMCASGGHRLEPMLLGIGAQGSFSDAHESIEIPILAANLQRAILPRQSQIWAVLHTDDTDRQMIYTLAAPFLGRMCLSGQIPQLSPTQWQLVTQAMALYRQAAPIIRDGVSRQHLCRGRSYRHPTGWQGIVRSTPDAALVVLHSFDTPPEASVSVELPPLSQGVRWYLDGTLHSGKTPPEVQNGRLTYDFTGPFGACVALLTTRPTPA